MRLGSADEQGHHPMRDDVDFTEDCRRFLRDTITALERKLVAGLGIVSSWFLAPYFDANWAPASVASSEFIAIRHFDAKPICVKEGVVFVTASHPAHFSANRRHRKLDRNTAMKRRCLFRRGESQASPTPPDGCRELNLKQIYFALKSGRSHKPRTSWRSAESARDKG